MLTYNTFCHIIKEKELKEGEGMLQYKIDVMKELKARGYTTYRIKTEKLIGGATIDAIRNGEVVGAQSLNALCRLLNMQPGDIIEYTDDVTASEEENNKSHLS